MFGFLKGQSTRPPRFERTVEGETIDLSPPGVDGNARHRHTRFIDCDITRSGPWPFALTDCSFEHCRFRLTRSFARHFWHRSRFMDCTFTLRSASRLWFQQGEVFENCVFEGTLKSGRFDGNGRKNAVRNIDLSGLKFDMIELRGGVQPDAFTLPPWPALAIVDILGKDDPRLEYLPADLARLVAVPPRDTLYLVDLARMKTGGDHLWPALRDCDWIRSGPNV